MKSRKLFSTKGMIIMANTNCYNIEGINVCTPEDIDKFGKYGLIGLAILAGVVVLGVLAFNNASIMGTELLDEPSYFLGF